MMRSGDWLEARSRDLHIAARSLRRNPAFTIAVIVTVAIGVGLAGGVYGVVSALLLPRPPHVPEPERVVRLYYSTARQGGPEQISATTSLGMYDHLATHATSVTSVGAYREDDLAIGIGADARMARAALVSGGFWQTVAVQPSLGRVFSEEESHPTTGDRVVVVGHDFWRRMLGGDGNVVGTVLQVKGHPYRIVGVAPRGFRGTGFTDIDLWLPFLVTADGEPNRSTWYAGSAALTVVARLALGAAPSRVEAELTSLATRYRTASNPNATPMRIIVAGAAEPLGADLRPLPEARVAVWLVGLAGVLILAVSANVASLVLLRSLRRSREIAVRRALGMTRARFAAQLLAELGLLAFLSAVAAACVVAWARAGIGRVLLPDLSLSAANGWTLSVTVVGLLVAVVGAGLAPLLMRDAPGEWLRASGPSASFRRSRLQRALLVAQIGLSAVLLVGAGLFIRSMDNIRSLDLGLDARDVMAVQVQFAGTGRPDLAVAAFYERALERVSALPGIQHASLATIAPLRGTQSAPVEVPGRSPVPPEESPAPPVATDVTPDFFATTGMTLVRGRGFHPTEREADAALIINETMERVYWPGESAIGQCLAFMFRGPRCVPVIGVVRDSRTLRLRETAVPQLFRPLPPDDTDDRVLLVRGAQEVRSMAPMVRSALHDLDPALPYIDIRSLADALDPQVRPWRLGAAIFTAFGIVAALLAGMGVYAVLAYAVAQRTREVGIRMALGASRPAIMMMVLRDGMRLGAIGIAGGLVVALAGAGAIAHLLFDVSPRDTGVLVGVAGSLTALVLLACAIPAWRAARVSPRTALQAE